MDTLLFWPFLASFLAAIAAAAATKVGSTYLANRRLKRLAKSEDADRVREELAAALLELKATERAMLAAEILFNFGPIEREVATRAAQRLENLPAETSYYRRDNLILAFKKELRAMAFGMAPLRSLYDVQADYLKAAKQSRALAPNDIRELRNKLALEAARHPLLAAYLETPKPRRILEWSPKLRQTV